MILIKTLSLFRPHSYYSLILIIISHLFVVMYCYFVVLIIVIIFGIVIVIVSLTVYTIIVKSMHINPLYRKKAFRDIIA